MDRQHWVFILALLCCIPFLLAWDTTGTAGRLETFANPADTSCTTNGALWYDSTNHRVRSCVNAVAQSVHVGTYTKCMVIESPVDADNLLFFRAENALTVTGIDCLVNAATSVPIIVQECNANGASCTTVEAAITCGTTNSTEAAGIDASAIEAGNWLRIDVGVPSGTPGQVAVCVNFVVP